MVGFVALTNGAATLTLIGIPGYKYHVQVSTNLIDWGHILVTNAPADAMFQLTDSSPPLPAACYRLLWNGN